MTFKRIVQTAYNRVIRWSLPSNGLLLGQVEFRGRPTIFQVRGAMIRIGDRSVLVSKSKYTALGVPRPTLFRTLTAEAKIEIGEDVGISGAVICAAHHISIGDRCMLGSGVKIIDTDFHPIAPYNRRFEKDWSKIRSAPVIIGNDVFIGVDAIILKGVCIEYGSIVGAGAVVAFDVPANSIVAGNPARIIGTTT